MAEIFESLEYDPAPENADLAEAWLHEHEAGFDHFIDGAWRKPGSGRRFATKNPATGEILGQLAQGNDDGVDGAVHNAPLRGVAMPEPMGIIGLIRPVRLPLPGFIFLLAPTIAMGNRVVIVPSCGAALVTTDFHQILETSDVPGGAGKHGDRRRGRIGRGHGGP